MPALPPILFPSLFPSQPPPTQPLALAGWSQTALSPFCSLSLNLYKYGGNRAFRMRWEETRESPTPMPHVERPVHIPAATVSKFSNRHPMPHHHVSSFMHGHLCLAARSVATQPTTAPQGPDISESKLTRGDLIPHAKQSRPP